MRWNLACRARQAFAAALVITLLASACAGEGDPAPTSTPAILTIRNETDCTLRFRFDNGVNLGGVLPATSQEYSDDRLSEYRYLKIESTRAIFRTLDMAQIRADGYTVTVRRAVEDGECVDKPAE